MVWNDVLHLCNKFGSNASDALFCIADADATKLDSLVASTSAVQIGVTITEMPGCHDSCIAARSTGRLCIQYRKMLDHTQRLLVINFCRQILCSFISISRFQRFTAYSCQNRVLGIYPPNGEQYQRDPKSTFCNILPRLGHEPLTLENPLRV